MGTFHPVIIQRDGAHQELSDEGMLLTPSIHKLLTEPKANLLETCEKIKQPKLGSVKTTVTCNILYHRYLLLLFVICKGLGLHINFQSACGICIVLVECLQLFQPQTY